MEKALVRFGVANSKGVNSPTEFVPRRYGATEQHVEIDHMPAISPERKTRIQQIVGVFLSMPAQWTLQCKIAYEIRLKTSTTY